MGKIVRKRKEFSGSSNSAENIMYDATKNVKEAIDEAKNEVSELNSNLENLINREAVISGNHSSSTSNDVTFSYPDGFTYDNCYIASRMTLFGDTWRESGTGYNVLVSLKTDLIHVSHTESGLNGLPFKLVLRKY